MVTADKIFLSRVIMRKHYEPIYEEIIYSGIIC